MTKAKNPNFASLAIEQKFRLITDGVVSEKAYTKTSKRTAKTQEGREFRMGVNMSVQPA